MQEQEYYSEPVQEIMGTIPPWIIRWGVMVIAAVFVLILIGCCIIKVPQTIKSTISIISIDVKAGVVPDAGVDIEGRMKVSSVGFGLVEKGQTVNVRLNGFPYMEFGILKGVISRISQVPERMPDGSVAYNVEVSFPNGLVSTYRKEFPFIQGMDGEAEIITREQRLIELFIGPVISVFRNH